MMDDFHDTYESPKTTRSGRKIREPERYDEVYEAYCLMSSENDPVTCEKAMKQRPEGKIAVKNELKSLAEKETWKETKLPIGAKAIDTKWVFRIKSEGSKKARLVARGFQQQTDDLVFSPVAKMTNMRLGTFTSTTE